MNGLTFLVIVSASVHLACSCGDLCAPEVLLRDKELSSYAERFAGLLRNHAVKVGWEKVAVDAFLKKFGSSLTSKQKIAIYCALGADRNASSVFISEIGSSYQHLHNDLCARKAWQQGILLGYWPSMHQRPLLQCCKELNSEPWHDEELQPLRDSLESNCNQIGGEVIRNSAFISNNMIVEQENERTFYGSWKTLVLYDAMLGGSQEISAMFPAILNSIQPFISNITFVKLSKLTPGSRILPHTGPTNCALRTHFTVYHSGGAQIRVGGEWRAWQTCKAFTFDSSFEHEVIHDGPDERIVLIVDSWRDHTPDADRKSYCTDNT